MSSQPWVVTGNAGFLGSHVVEQLLLRGSSVVGIDNLAWGRREHVRRFQPDIHFQFHKIDIRDSAALSALLLEIRPAAVIHLAALHFIPAAMADPPLTVSINVHGTQSLLTACRNAGVESFWFASTGDVYAPSELACQEADRLAPFNIYGLTKLMGEQLVALESKVFPQKRFTVGRLFNLYGSRETNPHILPSILSQLRTQPKAPLRLGNIWPRRDMVPVNEAARAIIESIERSPAGLTIVNVATGTAWSIQELIAALEEVLGHGIAVETDPSKVRSVERTHLQGDVKELRALLGWVPHADLRRGLSDVLVAEDFL